MKKLLALILSCTTSLSMQLSLLEKKSISEIQELLRYKPKYEHKIHDYRLDWNEHFKPYLYAKYTPYDVGELAVEQAGEGYAYNELANNLMLYTNNGFSDANEFSKNLYYYAKQANLLDSRSFTCDSRDYQAQVIVLSWFVKKIDTLSPEKKIEALKLAKNKFKKIKTNLKKTKEYSDIDNQIHKFNKKNAISYKKEALKTALSGIVSAGTYLLGKQIFSSNKNQFKKNIKKSVKIGIFFSILHAIKTTCTFLSNRAQYYWLTKASNVLSIFLKKTSELEYTTHAKLKTIAGKKIKMTTNTPKLIDLVIKTYI